MATMEHREQFLASEFDEAVEDCSLELMTIVLMTMTTMMITSSALKPFASIARTFLSLCLLKKKPLLDQKIKEHHKERDGKTNDHNEFD
jgi:hypothetical protein